MNLLGEFKLSLSSGEVVLKLTNKALYRSQLDLNKKGLLDLVSGLDTIDLLTVYTLAANCCSIEITAEELLEEDIDLIPLAQFLAEQIAVLLNGKKNPPVLKTKKQKK